MSARGGFIDGASAQRGAMAHMTDHDAVASRVPALQWLGRYRVLTTLGQGGMGTIHLAVADGLGEFRKLIVLKELRQDLACRPQFVEMFLEEAKLAAGLSHPNIVHTLEATRIGERYVLAMEFLDGQALHRVLASARRAPTIPLNLRLHILCEALSGLHYAHELCDYAGKPLQIIHRDVCPMNIFVTYDGQVKVVDFGIARAIDSKPDDHRFQGKLAYAAPEQLGPGPVDRRVDVFAAGVVLWELITLRRFAPGASGQASIDARIAGLEPRIAAVAPDVDPALAAICDTALLVDPDARYESADELRRALLSYLAAQDYQPDRTQLAQLVREKFSTQRSAMHELIHTELMRNTTDVRALYGGSGPDAEDEVTTVADLSELIEYSRPGGPPSAGSQRPVMGSDAAQLSPDEEPAHTASGWRKRPRRRRLDRVPKRAALALGLTVLVAVAAIALWGGNGQPEAAATADHADGHPLHPQDDASTTSQTTRGSDPDSPVARSTQTSLNGVSDPTATPALAPTERPTAMPRRGQLPGPASASQAPPSRGAAPPPPHSPRTAPSPGPHEATGLAPDPDSVLANPYAQPEARAQAKPGVWMGMDLSKAKRTQPREVTFEDPFD